MHRQKARAIYLLLRAHVLYQFGLFHGPELDAGARLAGDHGVGVGLASRAQPCSSGWGCCSRSRRWPTPPGSSRGTTT